MPALASALLDFSASLPYPPFMREAAISLEEILGDVEKSLPEGSLRMPFTIREIRKLTPVDLIAGERVKVAKQPKKGIAKIRQSHHTMARMLAMGKNPVEIAQHIGCSPATIHKHIPDPAFQELIAYYTTMTEQVYVDVMERIAGFTTDAMEVLHERILEKPDDVKTEDIIKVITMGLDRSGYGPKSTVNQNIRAMVVTDAQLDRIKEEASLRRVGAVRSLSADSEPGMGQTVLPSTPLQIEAEAEGQQSEGPLLREEIHEDAEGSASEGSGPEAESMD